MARHGIVSLILMPMVHMRVNFRRVLGKRLIIKTSGLERIKDQNTHFSSKIAMDRKQFYFIQIDSHNLSYG